jgi:hypothetical protein
VAPPRSRLSPSPGVGRGEDRHPRSRLSPSPGVGRGGDRRPRSRLSPSPGVGRGGDRRPRRGRFRALGSGEAETVFWSEVESEPWGRARRRPSSEARSSPSPGVGRGGDCLLERGRVRALGSGEAETIIRGAVKSEPWGRARRRLSSGARSSPSPGVGRGGGHHPRRGQVRALGSGEAETVFWSEVESEPWGRARRRLSSGVEVGSKPGGRARRRPSSEARLSPSPRVGRGGDRLPESRLSPSPDVR